METLSFKTARDVLEEHARRKLPKDFCIVPFTTLQLEPDGLVGVCRQKGSEYPVGSLLENSFDEIWNGPLIREWRRQFLEGDVRNCSAEVKHRACHLCPD